MDSALSIWLWVGRPGVGAWEDSPSTDLLLRVWSLKVRGREPKLDTLGMPSLGSTIIGWVFVFLPPATHQSPVLMSI